MASVQFYGLDNAIEAYNNASIPAWGLFSGRQLLCRYTGESMEEGSKLLADFCEKIEYSNATYTLKVFEQEGNKALKIKENTPCDSSFNFKIQELDEYARRKEERGNDRYMYGSRDNGTQNQINAINEKLDRLLEDGEGEEETPKSIGALAMSYLSNPTNLIQLINAIRGVPVTASTIGTIPETTENKTMSGVPIVEAGNQDQQREQDVNRLAHALDILEKADPQLVKHLEKLAELSIKSPGKFKSLISMLEMFA